MLENTAMRRATTLVVCIDVTSVSFRMLCFFVGHLSMERQNLKGVKRDLK